MIPTNSKRWAFPVRACKEAVEAILTDPPDLDSWHFFPACAKFLPQMPPSQVFFGGDPWMVMCSHENMTVPAAFVTAARKASLSGDIRWAVINCGGKLPSNRTLFQRFKIPA
jgi:hypothetical protein